MLLAISDLDLHCLLRILSTVCLHTASIEVDHSQEGRGSIIYQVLTTDTENDPLTFTSTVDSAFVPLAITEGQ